MPKCTPCLAPAIKDLILKEFPGTAEMLEGIADCKPGKFINVCSCAKGGEAKSKGKRPPSEYNLFIGQCMRGTERSLKDCAGEWTSRKAKS